MNELFKQHIDALHPSFEALFNDAPFQFTSLPKKLPAAGIYLFSEGGNHLYVGRTNRLRKRLQQHCRPGSSENQSPFAFRLAREKCNALKASYKKEGSRKHLLSDPAFSVAFSNAKARLREMDVRVVEETDPLRQALLEMYVAVALGAPYNDFDNH